MKKLNLKVAIPRLLHQVVKFLGYFQGHVLHRSASMQLFLAVWLFSRSPLGLICYDGWVLCDSYKNYFDDWCLMNSRSTFLILTYPHSLEWLNWFWRFLCERLSFFNTKVFYYSYAWKIYVKERLPFAWDLSLENSMDSYLCFRFTFLHSVSYLFFLYRSPSSFLWMVFDAVSFNIDEVSLDF